jgi:hypothetical protein
MGLHALLSQRVQRRVQVVLGLVRFRVPLVHPHQVRLPIVLLLHQLQLEELELHLLHLRRLRRVTFLLRLEEMLHERQASHLEVLVLELRSSSQVLVERPAYEHPLQLLKLLAAHCLLDLVLRGAPQH